MVVGWYAKGTKHSWLIRCLPFSQSCLVSATTRPSTQKLFGPSLEVIWTPSWFSLHCFLFPSMLKKISLKQSSRHKLPSYLFNFSLLWNAEETRESDVEQPSDSPKVFYYVLSTSFENKQEAVITSLTFISFKLPLPLKTKQKGSSDSEQEALLRFSLNFSPSECWIFNRKQSLRLIPLCMLSLATTTKRSRSCK